MESPPRADPVLNGLVLAPYGRDAQLLSRTLAECGGEPVICDDVPAFLERIRSGRTDLLVVSDDALASQGDDRVFAALRSRGQGSDDILPLVLLTGSADLVHPLSRLPGVVVVAKPTRRRILASVLRGALDARRRVLEVQAQRRELERRNRSLVAMTEVLEAQKAGLAQAIQTKDRFVATMSHELRTPLNSILLYADLLTLETKGSLNDDQRAYVDRIALSARHLVELIGDVLDLAKLNHDELVVERTAVDLELEVQEARTMVARHADKKGLHLTVQRPTGELPPVLGDQLRVRQVLLNLLSNAVKFTERGGVTVRFRHDEGGTVSVLVEDTGIGIAREELSQLFTEFYQADNTLTRRQAGTGLGLAISMRLARLMGGSLSAESRPGRGSTFTFTLRRADLEESHGSAAP
jgi:two-component system, NarL family, sensor histidine kinase BarA